MANTMSVKVENIEFKYNNLNDIYKFLKKNNSGNYYYVSPEKQETKQYIDLNSGDITFLTQEKLTDKINNINLDSIDIIDDTTFFYLWFINNFTEEKINYSHLSTVYNYQYTRKSSYKRIGRVDISSSPLSSDIQNALIDNQNTIFTHNKGFDINDSDDGEFPYYCDVYFRYKNDTQNNNMEEVAQNEVYNSFLYAALVMYHRKDTADISIIRKLDNGAPSACYKGQLVRYGANYYICTSKKEDGSWNLRKITNNKNLLSGETKNCSDEMSAAIYHYPIEMTISLNDIGTIIYSYNGKIQTLYNNSFLFKDQKLTLLISDTIQYAQSLSKIKFNYDYSNVLKNNTNLIYPNNFEIDFYYKNQKIATTDKISYLMSQDSGEINISNININYYPFFSGGVFDKYYNTSNLYSIDTFEWNTPQGYVDMNIKQTYGFCGYSSYESKTFLLRNDIVSLFNFTNNLDSRNMPVVATYWLPPGASENETITQQDNRFVGWNGLRNYGNKVASQDCFIYIEKPYDYTMKFNFYNSTTLLFSTNNITLSFDDPQSIELEWNDKDNSTLSTNIEIISDSVVIPKIKLKLKGKNNYSYGKYYLYLLTSETEKKLIKTQDINFLKELDDDENLFYFNDLLTSEYKIVDNYYTPYCLQAVVYTVNNEEITTPLYKIAVAPDEISLPNNNIYIENSSIKNENQLLLTFNKNIAAMDYSLKQIKNKYFNNNYYALSDNDSITLLFDENWHPNGQEQDEFLIITFYDDMSFKKFSMYMSILENIYAFFIKNSHGIEVLYFESSNLPQFITFSFHSVENSDTEELIKMQFVNTDGTISRSIKVATRHTKLIKIRQNNNSQDQWEETCALTSIVQNYNETIKSLWENSENSGEIRTIITFNNILKLESCEIYFIPISDDNISGEFDHYGDSVLNIIFTNNDRLEIYKNRILFFSENGIIDKIIDNENTNFIINNCKIHFNPLKIEIPQKDNIDLFSYYKNHYIDTIEIPANNMYSNNQEWGFVNTIKFQNDILGIQKNTTLENLYRIYDLSNFYNNQQYTNEIYNLLIEDYSIDYSGNKIINTIKNYIILNPDKNNFIQSLKTVIVPGHGYNFYIRACEKASRFDFVRTNLFYSIEPDPNYVGEYIRVIFLDEPKNTYSNYSLGNEFAFECNIEQGALTQNFEKTALDNYSKYPKFSIGNKNYFTGSVNCLLGDVKYREGETAEIIEYRQSIDLPYAYYEEMDIYNKWLENIASGKPALIIDQKGRTFVSQITDNSINMFTPYGPKPSGISFSFTECDDFANIKILEVS